MPNMNKFLAPCVYALHAGDFVFRYVGSTSKNSTNRLWEHNYRAGRDHQAPVYKWMREVGVENVRVVDLIKITADDDMPKVEASVIRQLIENGHPLLNAIARDGVPNSISPEMRSRIGQSRKGMPTWIAGKKGEEAGWTDERRARQSETMKARRRNQAA